jgi:hypothetical protein
MPIGTCDPATRGEPWNVLTLAWGHNAAYPAGQVVVTVRYGWDGVSTRETGCNGPLLGAHLFSAPDAVAWLHFKGRRGTPRSVQVPQDMDQDVTAQWLANRGLNDASDLEGFVITGDSEFPPYLLG